jgi:hypothetical protein
MGVSKEKVNQIINEALANGGAGATCCSAVGAAFRYLQKLRQEPGKSLDLDLAAAEHYMYARSLVCTGYVSAAQMRVLVIGYDVKKLLDAQAKDPDKQQVTTNPVAPPNIEIVLWGIWGVEVGQGQHDRCNKDISPPVWRPLKEIYDKNIGY